MTGSAGARSMDVWSACMIDTRIVYGFPGAGKTSYILDCIRNDYFHKYGKTLILCFERGKEPYDEEELRERNAYVVYDDDRKKIREFCEETIGTFCPDRIYVEMNAHIPMLRKKFPDVMQVTSAVTWFDWKNLDHCLTRYRQQVNQMVSESLQVTFRNCPSKELLKPYSQEFKLMNHRASYLRQDPMGYHEKAFDLFVPYSLDAEKITISSREYLPFWLDAMDHPEHYDGKILCFTEPLELRHVSDEDAWSAGRVVMTCCMSDLQFMSLELAGPEAKKLSGGWIRLEAEGKIGQDSYQRKVLQLLPLNTEPAAAPRSEILLQGSRGPGLSALHIGAKQNTGYQKEKTL